MSLTRSITRALTQPLTRAITDPGVGGGGAAPPSMTFELASGYIYARFPWRGDVTYAAVNRVDVTNKAASATTNGVVQVEGTRLIPIATARDGIAAAFNAAVSNQTIQFGGDDAPPLKYNNSYIGGNHGAAVGLKITSTAHGKTVGDIGSQWSDGSKAV